jgi:Na+/H+ antiporter NhaD/arsenite permease-like protein
MPIQMSWQGIVALIVFAAAILLIAVDAIDLTLAVIVGAGILIASGVTTLRTAVGYVAEAHETIALFFGGMVLVRAFAPTGIFEWIGVRACQLSRGSVKRMLLLLLMAIAPIAAVLPNAIIVILLAPVVIRIAEYFETDFVPLLFLLVFFANSSGLLTLVGDPASFVVGGAMNIGFLGFFRLVTPGAVLAILAVVALVPWLFRSLWQIDRQGERQLELPEIRAPFVVLAGAVILALELGFFMFGDMLTVPLYPAAVSLLGSVLALAIVHTSGLDTVAAILRDVDWITLIFFCCVFVMVGAMADNGVLAYAALAMTNLFGHNLALASISMLFALGVVSSVIPNIPMVVAMVPLLKGYLVNIGQATPAMMSANYTGQFPAAVIPLFVAMMFAATLGGNATLVGASSNLIAVGVSAQHGRRIKFVEWAKYGIWVTIVQLVVSAAYIGFRFLLPAIRH